MKILRLEFENLNSYKGKVSIDFTDPQYARNNNQFVISGEVGHGKSTVLDAISLALYGRTQRLGLITKKNVGEVMNRQSGECRAALEYKCKKGLFRSEFDCHRANKKRQGNPGDPNYTVSEINEDGSLTIFKEHSGSVKDLDDITAALIGLNYSQFSRCIMIPQGQFDVFLNSSEAEKAAILAKLSNTEYYKEIGAFLWEEANEKENEVKILRDRKALISVLTSEEAKNKETRISEISKELEKIEEKLQDAEAGIKAKNAIVAAKKKLNESETEFSKIASRSETIEAKKEELERAKAALSCEGEYLIYEKCEKELIAAKSSIIDDADDAEGDIKEQIHRIEEYLKDNKQDENIETLLASLGVKEKEVQRIEGEISKYRREYSNEESDSKKKHTESEELAGRKERLQEKLNVFAASNSYTLAKYIRGTLKKGDTCPVCGKDYVPASEEALKEDSASNTEETTVADFLKLQDDLDALRNHIAEIEKEIARIDTGLLKLNEQISDSLQKREQAVSEINTMLNPWGMTVIADEEGFDAGDVMYQLSERQATYTKNQELLTSLKIAEELEKKYDDSKISLEKALRANGFDSMESFLGCRRDKDGTEDLEETINKYQEEKTQAEVRLESAKGEYEESLASDCRKETLEELGQIKETLNNEKSDFTEERGRIKQELDRNKEDLEKSREIQKKIDELCEELPILQEIKTMIGRKDGSNFETFVQTILFKNFLITANKYLSAIFPSYHLEQKIENGESTLGINLCQENPDKPGEIDERGILNISGGEKFITSLALALGIAEFAGADNDVESIFLDEGFGSLSGMTMDLAIASLKKLSATGKTLGIITHVESVIEAFHGLEIKAEKKNGRSTLRGPGVTQS